MILLKLVFGKGPKVAGITNTIDLTITDKKWAKINLFRFTNVLFGKTVRPYLMDRGNNLMKEDPDVESPRKITQPA
jgi:hypothetical protein